MALSVWQRTIVTDTGDVIPAAEVEVREGDSQGALADLFADAAGTTPLTNPVTADAEGFVRFYVAGGRYYIEASGAGATLAWEDVNLELISDHAAETGDVHGAPTGARLAHTGDFTRRGGAEFPLILVQDPLRQAVEAETGGRMTVLYDAAGNPNYMHVVPRFRYEDLGFDAELGTGDVTAFDAGTGSIKPEIFIGAYQASSDGGNAVSQPFKNPWVSINWDASKDACDAMGPGWHLMTTHEWAAVALWCVANGFEPRGSTDHGRAHDATWEVGRRQDGDTYPPGDSAGVGNIYAGSGPATWRHNGDLSGIADLVGNVWEWQWGAKLIDGRLYAAPINDTGIAEADWGDTTVDMVFANPWTSSTTAGTQLTDRLMFTYAGINAQGRLHVSTTGERFPVRGGTRIDGSDAGLAALRLIYARSIVHTHLGFRPSYIPQ